MTNKIEIGRSEAQASEPVKFAEVWDEYAQKWVAEKINPATPLYATPQPQPQQPGPSAELSNAELLIAAAPDMLAALRHVIGDSDESDYMMMKEKLEAARAAIAKATGGTQYEAKRGEK